MNKSFRSFLSRIDFLGVFIQDEYDEAWRAQKLQTTLTVIRPDGIVKAGGQRLGVLHRQSLCNYLKSSHGIDINHDEIGTLWPRLAQDATECT